MMIWKGLEDLYWPNNLFINRKMLPPPTDTYSFPMLNEGAQIQKVSVEICVLKEGRDFLQAFASFWQRDFTYNHFTSTPGFSILLGRWMVDLQAQMNEYSEPRFCRPIKEKIAKKQTKVMPKKDGCFKFTYSCK